VEMLERLFGLVKQIPQLVKIHNWRDGQIAMKVHSTSSIQSQLNVINILSTLLEREIHFTFIMGLMGMI